MLLLTWHLVEDIKLSIKVAVWPDPKLNDLEQCTLLYGKCMILKTRPMVTRLVLIVLNFLAREEEVSLPPAAPISLFYICHDLLQI